MTTIAGIVILLIIAIAMFAPHGTRDKLSITDETIRNLPISKKIKNRPVMKEYSIDYIQSIQKRCSLDKKSFDLYIDAILKGDRYVILEEELVNYCIKQNENYLGDIEFESRRRIYNDSINIIKTTDNIDTLNGRILDVFDYWKWEDENESNKPKYDFVTEISNMPPRSVIRENISIRINNNIVRVAKYIHVDWFDKYNSLKTQKAKDNCTIKDYKKIDLCISTLIDTENKEKCISDINDIRNKIEDSYSKFNIS